ncbi:MFS transporter [Lachnospiraceae bacterium OF09-33XD]|nr:MFS transporter [Lachnospiraceae bacterium OF09-33XD]
MNSKRYKYLILAALCMVGFISMFCQYQMQPMANEIKSTMSLTDSQYSALFTAPMAPAIFISLICGIIVDKFGGRWPMFLSLVLGTLGLWGRVFATSYGTLYLCIFVVGFAATFGNSSNAKMFGGWFSPAESSVCIGIYMAFGALATAAATATTPHMPSLRPPI